MDVLRTVRTRDRELKRAVHAALSDFRRAFAIAHTLRTMDPDDSFSRACANLTEEAATIHLFEVMSALALVEDT